MFFTINLLGVWGYTRLANDFCLVSYELVFARR